MATSPVRSLVERLAGRLRFPYLFLVTTALFLLDLFIPDVIPLADEILLGLGVLLLGSLRKNIADRKSTPSSSAAPVDEQKQT